LLQNTHAAEGRPIGGRFLKLLWDIVADGHDTSLGATIGVVHNDCGEAQGNGDYEGNGE
jgi:hypothetical protein